MTMIPRLLSLALALFTLAGTASADTVKLSGSGTVFGAIALPGKAEVEKSSGHSLQLLSSNSGKGLADLASGASDIAMVSEPMDIAGPSAVAAGAKLDVKALHFVELKKSEIVFVVNAKNPVIKLSQAQLHDILAGKITNWKAVGGNDQAIIIFGEGPTAGTRALIQKVVLGGAEFGPAWKPQTSIKRVAELVAGEPAGIAGIGRSLVDETKHKVLQTEKIERPLAMVTNGAPTPAVKAVIDAYAKYAAAH